MKKTAARKSTRSAPRGASATTRRTSGAKRSTSSKPSASAAPDLTALLEEGTALAQDVLKKTRFAALADLAPTVVKAIAGYARRKPAKAAGVAVGVSGLLYLGRALMNRDSKDVAAPTPRAAKAKKSPAKRSA